MSVTLSGAGASCLAAQVQQDGSTALVLTALPTVRAVPLVLTETLGGYDNSPNDTGFTLTYEGIADTGGPIYATVPLLDQRTITPTRASAVPLTWPAPFNPADNAPYVFDLKTFLGDEPLDTLVGASIDVVAAALGVMIDTDARRPIVDRANKRIAIWLKVDPRFQGVGNFGSPVLARVILTFATSSSPAATYRRSGFLPVKQVI